MLFGLLCVVFLVLLFSLIFSFGESFFRLDAAQPPGARIYTASKLRHLNICTRCLFLFIDLQAQRHVDRELVFEKKSAYFK